MARTVRLWPALAGVSIAVLIGAAPASGLGGGTPLVADDVVTDPPVTSLCPALPTLLGVERAGARVAISGLAATSSAGRQAKVQALLGTAPLGRAVYATIRRNGAFDASLPLPPRSRRHRVSYRATVDDERTASRLLEPRILVVSRTKTAAGTRVIGQVDAAGRRTITITRRACGITRMLQTTGRTSPSGRFDVLLPRPTAPDTLALYRASATIGGARTYSVDIAVRR